MESEPSITVSNSFLPKRDVLQVFHGVKATKIVGENFARSTNLVVSLLYRIYLTASDCFQSKSH